MEGKQFAAVSKGSVVFLGMQRSQINDGGEVESRRDIFLNVGKAILCLHADEGVNGGESQVW